MKSYLCKVGAKLYRQQKDAHHKVLIKTAAFFCLVLLCSVLGSGVVLAATGAGTVPQGTGPFFYIRQGGSGNGSDWSNAMGDLPSTFQRGATYYVAAGTYGGHSFDTPASGSQWITVKRATRSEHGTSTGWQDAYDGTALFTEGFQFTTPYWNIDGVTGTGKGPHGFELFLHSKGSQGILLQGSNASYISLRHIWVHWPDRDNANYIPSTGVYAPNGPSNITVAYCYFSELGGAFYFVSPSGGSGSSNVLIEYSAVNGTHSDAYWHASGLSMRNGTSNFTVRYNWFQDMEGTGGFTFYDPGVHSNWEIYGNVFYNSGDSRAEGFGHGVIADNCQGGICGTSNVRIYNNSFVNLKPGTNGVRFFGNTSGNVLYNNIWYGSNNVFHGGVNYDYNYYANTFFYLQDFNPAAHEPASDAGKRSVVTADPFVDSAHENFHLKAPLSGYPGMSLSAPYNQDMEGRVRGSDGVWDRGAYEYGPGGGSSLPSLTPPQNLRIQN